MLSARRRRTFTAATSLLASCSILEPTPAGNGSFEIFDVQVTRGADQLGVHVSARIRNTTTRDLFARVGDRFNAAQEQEQLGIAQGTHASVERQRSDGTWEAVPLGVFIEGTKLVVLKAGKSYQLSGPATVARGSNIRIKFSYVDENVDDGGAGRFVDYSRSVAVP